MKKTTDQPLTKLADAAFEQAAQKVIERAQQSGTPVILWEDEAVKEVEPQQRWNAELSKAHEKNGG
jgi:ABC-type sugar transport system substrate-binding protein